jgi:hypothetical protein
MAALFGAAAEASLPTYKTAANVLEKKKGSGVALLGWTVARTLMIAPPFMLFGIPAWQAFAGAATASVLISLFTVLRIFNAAHTGLGRPSTGRARVRRR